MPTPNNTSACRRPCAPSRPGPIPSSARSIKKSTRYHKRNKKRRDLLERTQRTLKDKNSSKPGNLFGGHTLEETIEQSSILANPQPKTVIADKGYRGIEIPNVQTLLSGQKPSITRTLHNMIKRLSAIEPILGYIKWTDD